MTLNVKFLDNEFWWGGSAAQGEQNPFTINSNLIIDYITAADNQTMPLFISNKGRCIWSDKPFKGSINSGEFVLEGEDIVLEEYGSTLKDAYLGAMQKHFPFEDKPLPDVFFKTAQYNTWMEFGYDQRQENVLKYAHDIVDNGFKPGILMIDEGWQREYGDWRFNTQRFPDPKQMVDELHSLGFVIMLWVTPFVSLSGQRFVENEFSDAYKNGKLFLRVKDEWHNMAIDRWWNGYSGILDLTNPTDISYMQCQLDALVNDYGIDGFKFDGGNPFAYSQPSVVNGIIDSEYSGGELNIAWNAFGAKYKFHEYKDTWKGGGKATIQRLQDRAHDWNKNGLNTILPTTLMQGLIGHPYICPDMIGGGEYACNFNPDFEIDEELFVRMAQASALCPMMQFSWAPWRVLSPQMQLYVNEAAKLHSRFADEIINLVAQARKTGEPIVRCLEYEYPNEGYAHITDEFLLGKNVLVAPVLEKGVTKRNVTFPPGSWSSEDGKVYNGGSVYEVESPLSKLLWFRKIL